MFNVKHDFGFIGRLFGVPRSWLSKIGAFCSSFSTRGQLLDLTVPDNPDPANAPVVLEVNEKALRAFVLANAPTPETPVIPDNVLTSNDIGTTVAAVDHTHDTVYAAKDHTHNDYVDTSNNQDVSGAKTFSSDGGVTISGNNATLIMRAGKPINFYGGPSPATIRYSIRTGGTNQTQLYLYASNNANNKLLEGSSDAITLGSTNIKVMRAVLLDIDTYKPSVILSNSNYRNIVPDVYWVASLFLQKPSSSNGVVWHSSSGQTTIKTVGNGSSFDIASGSHDHDSVYAAKDHDHDNAYAAKSHSHSGYALATHTHSGYAAASHTHTALTVGTANNNLRFVVFAENATSSSLKTVTLSDLKYSDSEHSGNCLIKVDKDGNVSHTGNNFYDALNCISGWFSEDSQYNKAKRFDSFVVGHNVTSKARTAIREGGIEIYGSQYPYIDFHYNLSNTDFDTRIIGTNAGIKIEGLVNTGNSPKTFYLSSHPIDTDLKTGSTNYLATQVATCGFVNEKVSASNPSSKTSIAPTSDGANASAWTAGGDNGLTIKQLVRAKYVTSGTTPVLYGYYRTFTYDKFGRLYSISAESREAIDTTFLVDWS